MNDAVVSKQIQQMVRLIRQEAEEKANRESRWSGSFLGIQHRRDFQAKAPSRVDYSTQLNARRIKYLQAHDDVVTSMRLRTFSVPPNGKNAYKKLLKGLILEIRKCLVGAPETSRA